MDLAVIPSRNESFGVSAIEAQASGVPVVISDIPGLMEATCPGKSSLVFHKENVEELSKLIIEIANDKDKNINLGNYGVEFARDNFEYNKCFSRIEDYYKNIIIK